MSPANTSSTARPAEKGARGTELDSALVRRTVTALCELSASAGRPIRRQVARDHVLGWLNQGHDPDAILHGARDSLGILDETGETATRRADRGRLVVW